MARRIFDDTSGERAAVLGGDGEVFVAVADDLVGIDHVGEDRIEVAAPAADQIRPHFLPAAVELVADHAGGGENELAVGKVGFASQTGLLLRGDERFHVVRRILPRAEHLEGLIADGLVLARRQRTSHRSRETAGADFFRRNGVQHGLRPSRTAGKRLQRGDAQIEILRRGLREKRCNEIISSEVRRRTNRRHAECGGRARSQQRLQPLLYRVCLHLPQRLQHRDAILFRLRSVLQHRDHFLHRHFIPPQHCERLRVLPHVRIR